MTVITPLPDLATLRLRLKCNDYSPPPELEGKQSWVLKDSLWLHHFTTSPPPNPPGLSKKSHSIFLQSYKFLLRCDRLENLTEYEYMRVDAWIPIRAPFNTKPGSELTAQGRLPLFCVSIHRWNTVTGYFYPQKKLKNNYLWMIIILLMAWFMHNEIVAYPSFRHHGLFEGHLKSVPYITMLYTWQCKIRAQWNRTHNNWYPKILQTYIKLWMR